MNRIDDGTKVVRLANPKTLEYQVVRTSLLPGLLKTVRENKAHPLPLKVFETSDVVIKDPGAERQARNIRHAAALWCNKTAGFEVVHGLLDRVMAMLEVPRIQTTDSEAQTGYYLKETAGELPRLRKPNVLISWFRPTPSAPRLLSNSIVLNRHQDATFFPGRAAKIMYRSRHPTAAPNSTREIELGVLGILHPTVLVNFEIPYPCSAVEFNLEPFLKPGKEPWE